MIEPKTPFELMALAPIKKQKSIDRLVESINTLLETCLNDLAYAGAIVIGNGAEQEDPDWRLFHFDAAIAFREKGWIVEVDPDHLGVYTFRLPGHMLHDPIGAKTIESVTKTSETVREWFKEG